MKNKMIFHSMIHITFKSKYKQNKINLTNKMSITPIKKLKSKMSKSNKRLTKKKKIIFQCKPKMKCYHKNQKNISNQRKKKKI
jgi:hypothetical protein